MQHSVNGGGAPEFLVYQWQWSVDYDPAEPESATWNDYAAPTEYADGWGLREVIIEGASPLFVDDPDAIRGKRVLVVEDGPTLTHGEMKYGAGVVAAKKYGAAEIVDPRPWVKGTIAETFEKYPGIGPLLPAMGYGDQQVKDLQRTIDAVDCDAVVVGTPIDLSKVVKIGKPSTRVQYKLQEIGSPTLEDVLRDF